MANYGVYVTVEQLRAELNRSDDITDESLLKQKCERASRLFDLHTHRHFYPVLEARTFDHPANHGYPLAKRDMGYGVYGAGLSRYQRYVPSRLEVDDDLLAVSTLTTNNGGTTISSSDYVLKTGHSSNYPPYTSIELKTNGTTTVFNFNGTPQDANSVTGHWGYHTGWDNDAWIDSTDEVEDNPLSSSATTVTVNNARLIDVQNLIRIEDEYLYVTNRNTSGNTLTVIRGVNGTTAASHIQNTQIDIYQPMWDVAEIVTQWAVFLTRLRNSPYGVGGTQELGQTEISSLRRSDLFKMSSSYVKRARGFRNER